MAFRVADYGHYGDPDSLLPYQPVLACSDVDGVPGLQMSQHTSHGIYILGLLWFRRAGRMVVQVLSQCRPILASVHRANPGSPMLPLPIHQPREGWFQRRVSIAKNCLSHVSQTVLDMVGRAGAVGHECDSKDVETVQLMDERNEEGAVGGPEVGEPTRLREQHAPVVIGKQREVTALGVEHKSDGREVKGKLRRKVVVGIRWYILCMSIVILK